MGDGMLVCVVGRGGEDIERSENVRNNITTNRTCTSPKGFLLLLNAGTTHEAALLAFSTSAFFARWF
jgi:hypothetical protein